MEENAAHLLRPVAAENNVLNRLDLQIRIAHDGRFCESSSALIQRMYAWRGYKTKAYGHRGHADQITLQACRNERVFGTLTLCFDGRGGLAADTLYRRELDAYRLTGARLCELTSLAVDPHGGSKEVLGTLFHVAYVVAAVLRRASDVFVEVHPRHVNFYKRMLHFREAGECRMCERVDAPAVLLHLSVAHARAQVERNGVTREETSKSMYRFFAGDEEQGLAGRIRRQHKNYEQQGMDPASRGFPHREEGKGGAIRL